MVVVPDNGPYPWEQPVDLTRRETQYLVFAEIPFSMHGGKTRRWRVLSKSSGALLARIVWYGPWRQFTMHPEPRTVFNKGCLTDINTFIDDAMHDWREAKKK